MEKYPQVVREENFRLFLSCKQFSRTPQFQKFKTSIIPDSFNYSKNLSVVLGQVLKPLGYSKRGTRFILSQGFFEFSFNLPRSSWNGLTDRPKNLSVYLEVESLNQNFKFSIPLFRLTKESFPVFYGPFFLDKLSWTEKSNLMASFTDKQLSEIENYSESIRWYYDSEESLMNLLNEIKEQLINVGLPTIDFIKNYQAADMETSNLNLEIRTKVQQLYLVQLDPSSRFPTD